MTTEEDVEEMYQVVSVGDCCVGKSAVAMQFLKGFFLDDYEPTGIFFDFVFTVHS
jgi:GTPase SAR1 family protein